jgi:hypothetical protein
MIPIRSVIELFQSDVDFDVGSLLLPYEVFKEGWLLLKRNATLAAQTGWSFKVAQTLKNHPSALSKVTFHFLDAQPPLLKHFVRRGKTAELHNAIKSLLSHFCNPVYS